MNRAHWRSFSLVGLSLACGGGAPRSDHSADAPASVVRTPVTALDSSISKLLRQVAPLDSAFLSVPAAVRPDSGSTRADSMLLVLQATLDDKTRAVVSTFDDSAFQALIWPEGYHGYQRRRADGRADQPVPAADALAADSIRRFLLIHGIWSYMAEGDGYFVISLDRLMRTASPFVTDAAREALRIEILEQVSPTGGDAAVGIPWDSLGDRLAATDRFLAAYPNAPARSRIQDHRMGYLRAFLTGWDNTAVFDRGTKTLRPEVRASFERFLEIYGATASARVVRAYLDLLVKTRYRRTPAIDAFLQCEVEMHDVRCRR